jgi:hypothetical protein
MPMSSMSFQSVEVEGPIDVAPSGDALLLSVHGPGRGRLVARGIYRDDSPPEVCPFGPGEDVPIEVDIDLTVTDEPRVAWLRPQNAWFDPTSTVYGMLELEVDTPDGHRICYAQSA